MLSCFFSPGLTGPVQGDSCEFPLIQADIAEATGLSKVHVNRTLQELRPAGLIMLKDTTLTVPSLQRLMNAGLFNANHLHMDREGRQLDAHEQHSHKPYLRRRTAVVLRQPVMRFCREFLP